MNICALRCAMGTGICNHTRANMAICGKLHGRDGGEHALNCKIGGGVEKRHNDIRDALRDWLGTVNVSCMTEQEMPKWHRPEEKARLDVVYTDARLGEVCVDVSLVNAVTEGGAKRCLKALERREKSKHVRYPGAGLFAFVLDVRGRWGREAHAFVQSVVGTMDPLKRADAIKDCRRRVSRALHLATAEQLMSAAASPPVMGDVRYGR